MSHMCAVLLADVAQILTYYRVPKDTEQEELYTNAMDWLASDETDCGSFRYVCEVLEADPSKIRARMLALKKFDKSLLW